MEEHGGLLVADAQSAEVLESRDGAFEGPATHVPTQGTSVLGHVLSLAAPAVRRDQLDALPSQVVVEHVAVVGLVADDPLGVFDGQHEVQQALDQRAFVRALLNVPSMKHS